MKMVSVKVVAFSDSKNKAPTKPPKTGKGKKLDLFPLETVKQRMSGEYGYMYEDLADALKGVKQNTTYTFASGEPVKGVPVEEVTDMGKMKLLRFDEDGISFHNLQVYKYKGKFYGLEKDFDRLFDL